MKKLQKLTILFCLLILTNCGFQLSSLETNYKILEINTNGDKKINYKLKTKVSATSKENNNNLIKLNINTKKNKTIKEKNISNQVTKYEINIICSVEYKSLNDKKEGSFTILKRGDYSVSSKYSDTLNNEKNLINSLVNNISEEIIDNLTSNFNDL